MSNSIKYRFLSVAVIAVMSIALAACGGDSGNNTTGGGSSGGGNNASLLKQAAASMKAAKSYHIDVSGSSGGSALTMNGDFDIANNNSNLTISAAGQNVQVVSISNTTYLSTDAGKTFTNAGSAGGSITSGMSQFTGMWNSFNPADVDKAASALKDGSPATDTINGTSCHHITGNLSDLSSLSASGASSASATPTAGTADIWAANDGSSICQLKVTTTDGSTNITIKWSNINGVPAITAPPTSN